MKILVAAPDASFRRSLAFVLEAEGGQVDMVENLPGPDELSGRYDCLVIDHGALAEEPDNREALLGLGLPIVMLASQAQDMIGLGYAQVAEKPLLGRQLVESVREALANGPGKASPT